MKFKFLFLFILISYAPLSAQYNELYISNPQGWQQEPGNITDATLTIHPRGVYMEYGLYLTIAPLQHYFAPSEQLEIVLNFALPEEAHIVDSWLWVEGDIVKADIIDRWTATQIYEDIVDRRQDPSLLIKQNQGQYQLRIYPLFGDDSRKVKITYLMPTTWKDGQVQADIPSEILSTSINPVELKVRAYLDTDWSNPSFTHDFSESFDLVEDPNLGTFYESSISNAQLRQNVAKFQLDVAMQDGIYLSTFETEEDNFYQIVYQPEIMEENIVSQKLAILIDYQSQNTQNSSNQILSVISNNLKETLSPTDSFSLFLSGINLNEMPHEWIAASAENIDAAFEDAVEELATYSNLPDLLSEGIEFTQENGGSILLAANSHNFRELNAANDLLNDIQEKMADNEITIHVSDFQNRNINYTYIGNQRFQGNAYLYSRLTGMTGGEFSLLGNNNQSRFNTFFSEGLQKALTASLNILTDFDFHTSLSEGFTYSRYDLNYQIQPNHLNRPFIQIGKYAGEGDFEIELASNTEGNFFYDETTTMPTHQGTNALRKAWTGQWIQEQERSSNNSNGFFNEIVNTSMEERVLSIYTAFLALEPAQGGQICDLCDENNDGSQEGGNNGGNGGGSGNPDDDDVVTVAVDNVFAEGTLEYSITPNPFRESTTVTITLGEKWVTSKAQIAIYNQLGQVVYTFREQDLATNQDYTFTWNGQGINGEELPKGIYFFSIQTEQGIKVLKLVYQ